MSKKKNQIGEDRSKVGKFVFREHADFNCNRNLFLNLSEIAKDPLTWRKKEEIIPRSRLRRATSSQLVLNRGKNYEQEIYKEIAQYGNRIFKRKSKKILFESRSEASNFVYATKVKPSTFNDYVLETPNEVLCLLEHEFELPNSFKLNFPILDFSLSRPDIIIIRPINSINDDILFLDKKGEIKESKSNQIKAKYGLSVIDIKSIPEDRISTKYISEIIYYLKTLNAFIVDNQLDDFIVLCDKNGILPNIENVKIYDYEDLFDQIVEIDLEQTVVLFDNTMGIVDEFTKNVNQNKQIDRNEVEMNLDVHCDKCYYLDDCLKNCGYNQKDQVWDNEVNIDVLPNVNSSVIANLKQNKIATIDDLIKNLPNLSQSTLPKPINSILPLLDHKTKSISSKGVVPAKVAEIHSTSIPGFSRNRVTFTLETDSTTDLAFGFGIYFETSMNTNSNAKYKELYSNWWLTWYQFIKKINSFNEENYEKDKQRNNQRDKIKATFQNLQNMGFMDLSEHDTRKFAETLLLFNSKKIGDRNSLIFTLPNSEIEIDDDKYQLDQDADESTLSTTEKKIDEKKSYTSDSLRIEIAYVNIASNITKDSEENFVKQIIETVAKIIQLTFIIERNIGIIDSSKGYKSSWANTAFYYWSSEIVEKFEELLENHMQSIIEDKELYNDLYSISQWISPSNQVSDPNQVKRLYDISKFVQSVLGLPVPINYTWHTTAEEVLPNYRYSKLYWSPYFNNIDRSHWHEYILKNEVDQIEGTNKYLLLQLQIYYKLRTLARLVTNFQFSKTTRPLISNNRITKPKEVKTKVTDLLPMSFHPLARNWYIFARLTEAIAELGIVELRTDYPQAAIGKLEAAKVSNLKQREIKSTNKFVYSFDLEGLSRNVKFSEDDTVLLIPINIRDSILSYDERPWEIKIEQMTWDNQTQTYHIVTSQKSQDIFELLRQTENPISDEWFIYPKTGGYWADKLFNTRSTQRAKSLLLRSGLGRSLLGQRLSVMWNLGPAKELPTMATFTFPAPQIYMFAPDLIQKYTRLRLPRLLTSPEYPPDPSQEEAIHFALESPLRLILGPPGTGKSQTIVALIDEFLRRRHEVGKLTNNILIASFAYTASNVLLEKICQSVDTNKDPTLAALADKIFIMSQSKDLPQLSGSGPTYHVDRLSWRSNGWDFTMANNNNERITPSSEKLDDYISGDTIFLANAHQIYHLDNTDNKGNPILYRDRLEFDLIIVDEASQLPTDHMLSIYQHVRSSNVVLEPEFNYQIGSSINPIQLKKFKIINPEKLETQVIFVGDDSQLPPVQPIKPPENLKIQLGSIFDYYKGGFHLDFRQLKFNYRSHDLIVKFTESLKIYESLEASPVSPNRDRLLPRSIENVESETINKILDPKKVVVSLVHDNRFDTSVSLFEANLAVDIILSYFKMVSPKDEEEEIQFWYEGLGIVAPHNAHSRTIINLLFQRINSREVVSNLNSTKLMVALKDTIFSVEKFQGSERDLIIGTVGVSAKDQLKAEEDFIYDLNRINVLTTRAKSKMILICSKNFLEHIPRDRDRFFDVSILKKYTFKYCNQRERLVMPSNYEESEIDFYWRSVSL